MTKQLVAVGVVAAFLCVPAFAETGAGDATRARSHDILDAANAHPLSQLGPDTFRFSRAPALGGRGYVMTFVGDTDAAWAEIVWFEGHPSLGWRRTRRERLNLDPSEYRRLAAFTDAQLARNAPDAVYDGEEAVIVCTDGPGYLVERRLDGAQTWLRGFCGFNHPNDEIAGHLTSWALDRLGDR